MVVNSLTYVLTFILLRVLKGFEVLLKRLDRRDLKTHKIIINYKWIEIIL